LSKKDLKFCFDYDISKFSEEEHYGEIEGMITVEIK